LTAAESLDQAPASSPSGASSEHRLRRGFFRAGLVFGLVCLALWCVHRPLLVGYAFLFRVHDPASSDALVVLLGQWTSRPLTTAELYRQGLAPVILMCEADPGEDPGFSDSALTRAVLIRGGVPDEAIQVLPGVIESTREEALRVRDYAHAHRLRRITVVTNAFHTARARWIFRKTLQGEGVEVRMAAARDPRFDESNWYAREIGRACYLSEPMKTIYYRLKY
jgi:uncharacterized SAM-binding protein YcdF (DUF218 family)